MNNPKNLNQLKKAIKEGREFTVIKHYYKPEYTGQKRKPFKVQTNGVYTHVVGQEEQKNRGLGIWLPYEKAKNWIFTEELITFLDVFIDYNNNEHIKKVMEITF